MDHDEITARNAEIAAYRAKTLARRRLIWYTGLSLRVGVGFTVLLAWSFIPGAVLATALALASLAAFLRLDKAMQIRRFPELRGQNVRWRRSYFL